MAVVEDPASVLEQFMHDSANLPAEIAHLMEEMQAKESQIQECRNVITHRDGNIQKFIKLNGSLVPNPKEEAYSKTVSQQYDRAQILQEEKVGLSERAAALLDRHIKRFDIKIRDLQNDGSMQIDPSMPSLLRESSGNLVPAPSSANTGANTPLHPLSGNAGGGAPNIANAAMARMASAAASGRINSPSVAGMQPHPLLSAAHLAAAGAGSRQREMSVGSDSKRRRLNASLGAMPATSSGLRQSSLGPSTPKAGTPGSRAGSVGPRPMKAATKKGLSQHHMRKKVGKGGIPKKSARRIMGHSRASPSTTGDDESVLSEGTGDDDMSAVHDGAADDDGMDVDEDEGDDTKYCTCRQVSFGDMVACDNANCPYQWFHWGCVGLTKEPVGEWLCPDCSRLPRNKIKKAS